MRLGRSWRQAGASVRNCGHRCVERDRYCSRLSPDLAERCEEEGGAGMGEEGTNGRRGRWMTGCSTHTHAASRAHTCEQPRSFLSSSATRRSQRWRMRAGKRAHHSLRKTPFCSQGVSVYVGLTPADSIEEARPHTPQQGHHHGGWRPSGPWLGQPGHPIGPPSGLWPGHRRDTDQDTSGAIGPRPGHKPGHERGKSPDTGRSSCDIHCWPKRPTTAMKRGSADPFVASRVWYRTKAT